MVNYGTPEDLNNFLSFWYRSYGDRCSVQLTNDPPYEARRIIAKQEHDAHLDKIIEEIGGKIRGSKLSALSESQRTNVSRLLNIRDKQLDLNEADTIVGVIDKSNYSDYVDLEV